MSYLSSENIKIYPSGYRGTDSEDKQYDPASFLNTENNITSLARRTYNNGSFIVSFDSDSYDIEIAIQGYLFKFNLENVFNLDDFSSYKDEKNIDIYATIKIKSLTLNVDTTSFSSPILVGYEDEETILDEDDTFKGLYFSSSDLTSSGVENDEDGVSIYTNVYSLKIWDGTSVGIPIHSYLRVSGEQVKSEDEENNIHNIEEYFKTDELVSTNATIEDLNVSKDSININNQTFTFGSESGNVITATFNSSTNTLTLLNVKEEE